MDIILNAIKCVVCHEILESPVFLPCTDIICKKHVSNQSDVIRCEKCGVEHQILTNGFPPIPSLEAIIKSEIGHLDFGSVHKEAKKSCESVEEVFKEFEVLLKDPFVFTHEKISELKNSVQLKGEELKLRIDEEMKILLDKLEEYERQSKEIKFDEEKWRSIIEESSQKLKSIREESDKLKNKLLLNKYEENRIHVNFFKDVKIDSLFEYVPANNEFMDSRIIDEIFLSHKLEELLKKKELNGRKWSLLYRGSQDGFLGSDFHSRCDDKPNTLTIIKSTSGNIFGGFTSAQWNSTDSWEYDNSAFIYSLVNKENRPLIFDHRSKDTFSVGSNENFGPVFGEGNDIFISDCSNTDTNTDTNSFSNLGATYTHPEYPYGSDRAKTILAGTHHFQVQEIELFQLQQ